MTCNKIDMKGKVGKIKCFEYFLSKKGCDINLKHEFYCHVLHIFFFFFNITNLCILQPIHNKLLMTVYPLQTKSLPK